MIKINLSTEKKGFDSSKFGGIDLTKIRIGPLLVCIFLIYVPDWFVPDLLQPMKDEVQTELTSIKQEKSKYTKQLNDMENERKQIETLTQQEGVLTQKLAAVKIAISEKRNPSSLLLYIAKNIPQDLWINNLVIQGDSLRLSGEAISYQSIGQFIQSLKSSVFVKPGEKIGDSKPTKKGNVTVTSYSVDFSIARFE